ncbi:MAG: hypothetical protein Ct9H90mP18_01800 [Gammaproteobacteria bacterium]|nr:MAG: hypothetical protein Ct9H90mP18_01800 [Gammaproteobacteria bacterium]
MSCPREPKTLGIQEILNEFIKHRREVITRRKTLFYLHKSKNKANTLEGLGIALINVDKIIELIKISKTIQEAKNNLVQKEWEIGNIEKYPGVITKETKDFFFPQMKLWIKGKKI